MTKDDIIRMAREAGFADAEGVVHPAYQLEAFAAFVAAAEREACAKLCEAQITGGDYHYLANHGHWDHMAQASTNCAAIIRARSQS
jgi:hypothetical protein